MYVYIHVCVLTICTHVIYTYVCEWLDWLYSALGDESRYGISHMCKCVNMYTCMYVYIYSCAHIIWILHFYKFAHVYTCMHVYVCLDYMEHHIYVNV